MAKKKRKRVDYDSLLMSIYSPEYQYLMRQNAPENANVAGLGDWFSNLFNRNKQQPDYHRDTVSMGLGTENSLQGVGNGGIDWNNQDFSFTGQSNQQQFDYNPNSELNKAQQYQLSLKDPENLAPKQNEPNEQKKQNEQQPNTGSNINWGGIIGAAGTSAANAIQEGGSAADIAAGIMGIPVLAKMWKANTEWGDARIKEAQEKLTNPSIKFIQDANDTQGAGQGIKFNNQKNLDLIDTSGMLNTNNWKKFSSGRGSGTWWKNMATAQLQGAAAGSVGGPWGALGGATAGLLGSIGGLFGSKKRAKRAMNEYNRKITDIRNYANAENFRKIAERDLSNKNMLSNGLNQQKLQDMSNFKAFGGNLYPDGGTINEGYEEVAQEPIYEGGELPEITVSAESMPWYEKAWRKFDRNVLKYPKYAYNYFFPNSNKFIVLDDNTEVNRVIDENSAFGNNYILSNEFVEKKNPNTIRTARDFQYPNQDTLLGDNNIPLGNISTYYGIENGKLKAGKASDFEDDTFIVPNRTKNVGKIREIQLPEKGKYDWGMPWSDERAEQLKLQNEFMELNESFVNQEKYAKELRSLFDKYYGMNNSTAKRAAALARQKLKNNHKSEYDDYMADWNTRNNELLKKVTITEPKEGYVITENNDTLPIPNFNATPKMYFADENGNAAFVAGLKPNIEKVNDYLSEHPSYPIMVDNGRFKHTIVGGDINAYTGGFMNPEDNYIIGIKQKAMGGNLYTDLSPNMMNLWNDKQNIDKQKIMNQQMNFGLGNSFNQKLNTFDYGGSMNGMDLPTGMQSYENGGTHEQNPYGGIQVGVDQQGNPNLVEEGEFRWGDYVFSDRIEVDPDVLSMYNIASSKSNKKSKNKPSYADMAKKYADKNKELVNDPISKNSLNAYMDKLQKAQEDQKYQEQLQAQQDQQLADYRNALKSPTQSNPMYGSMKYNGLGNANQGTDLGNSAMDGVDNSALSNVNRSGNEMMGQMAAYGGNLFPYGGGFATTPENLRIKPALTPVFDMNNYMNNWSKGNNYYNYDLAANPNTEIGLTPYEKRYTDEYVGAISKEDPRVRQQILQDEGLYDGKIDGIWGKASQAAWDEFNKIRKGQYGTSMANSSTQPITTATSATSTQPVTTATSTSPVAGNKTYSSTSKSFGYSGVNEEAKREYDDKNKYESSNGTENVSVTNGTTPQLPVETRGVLENEQAGLAGYSPIDFNKYSEAGKYGQLAKGLMPNLMNWAGQTNWNYDPNWRPSNSLEALGHGSYTSRTADHLGDYIAPNLMDLERLNNASQAQASANARAIQNVANGRATGLASLVANDYNSQMGIGNNYATTEQYNADQKQKAAEFNRATNQFNAQANNDMYRDNLNAWMQGRQMDIQAMEAANRERQLERQYKDRIDRDAALNKQQDLAAMFDNQMNFLADEAKYNRDLNMLNSRRNNRFYYDKDKGWQFRGDNGYASDLNEYMAGRGVVLTSDDLNQIKQLDEDYGFGEESKAEKLAAAKSIIDRRKEVQDKEFADKATKEDEDLRFKARKASEIHKTLAALQDDKGNNIYGNLSGNDIYGKYLDRDLYDEYKKGKISKQDLEYYIEAMKDVERQYNNYHFSKYNNKVNTDAYGGKLNNRKRGDYYYMNV